MISKIYLSNFNSFFFLKDKKNLYLYIFFKNRSILIVLNSQIFFERNFNTINLYNFSFFNLKVLNYFFFSWKVFLVRKMKIKHKVSWLKIFRKNYFLVRFNFGYSYINYFFLYNIFLKKKKKYLTFSNIIFWTFNIEDYFYTPNLLRSRLYINQYTLRGIKFSQQKFIKRIGKISKYNEFKIKIL